MDMIKGIMERRSIRKYTGKKYLMKQSFKDL
jgi:hypothetical protein